MSITALLGRGRAAHLRLMRDTIRIERPGVTSVNPGTGKTTTAAPTVLYTGQARVKPMVVGHANVDVGEMEQVLSSYDVALPFTATGAQAVRKADHLVVTATDDLRLFGRTLVITALPYGRTTAWHVVAQDQQR